METTTQTNRPLLTGMFANRESAENAYNTLHERGYLKNDINLVMSDETRKKHFSGQVGETEIGTKAAEGAGTGGAIGGTLGAIAGAIAAIGTVLALPGLGLVIAGPVAAAVAGAGVGGAAGSLIGALVGSGIPEERAKIYEKGVKDGHIVVGVHPRNDEDVTYLENNWKQNKAVDIYK